jgi:ubiquitin thioesterase OTU1
MRFRVRGPEGQSTVALSATATVAELISEVAKATSIKGKLDIKYGYPPKPLPLEDLDSSTLLSDTGHKIDGEQLIVSEAYNESSNITSQAREDASRGPSERGTAGVPVSLTPSVHDSVGAGAQLSSMERPLSLSRKTQNLEPPELALPSHASTVVLRVMPDDNSCLFRAFGSAFFGAMDNMTELRSIVAQNVQAQPDKYPAVVLDKQPDDYCRWIQTEDAWGGAIELDIFSRHFDLEICSVDVQTLRVDRFNEGRPNRCILVYSGIHYDVIALSPADPPYDHAYAPMEFDTKIFDASDNVILEKAVDLCRILQGRHYFTDTANFSVRCNVCKKTFIGELGATEHASQTGHYDFGEAE